MLQPAFHTVRTATKLLCEPLAPDDYVVQSMPDASPVKWHLAHTSWFFEELVLHRFHDERYRYLFNSYYESVGPRHERAARGLLTRPTVGEVWAYRDAVDERMSRLLAGGSLSEEAIGTVTLGLHHEQQHQELLLTDLKHLFSCNPLRPAYRPQPNALPARPTPLSFADFAGGIVEIGHSGPGFCFDNELPRHRVYLQPFRMANRPVSNAEFHDFVRAGGYEQPLLWLSDGWACVQREGWRRPLYWSDSLEQQFTLAGMQELDPHAPVCHVSYYEADAFARWAGMRLPTEFEWEAAQTRPHPNPPPFHGGGKGGGILQPQMSGDVWEWTCSAYAPYPGFAPSRGALGEYNGKFMVNQLVLRGGSVASPIAHIRPSYRNFFYPQARWQVSGLRLAGDRLRE